MTKTEEPVPSAHRAETEQHKQASDTASAVLQDELIQAAVRERQLQMQLDKVKDQLQTWFKQRPNLLKEFNDFEREQEMKQRESRFHYRFLSRVSTLTRDIDIAILSV